MSAVVRFQPELADWLNEGLDTGQAPTALIQKMIDEQMQPAVAHALVDAFVNARRAGAAAPRDTLVVENDTGVFLREAPLIAAGATLPTSDGPVPVLARGGSPTLALLGAVMSPDECAQLIALARPRLVASTVVDPQTGQDVVAGYRNSLGMFFRPGENELIGRLDRRFAELMRLPTENGEGLQVLCYGPGAPPRPLRFRRPLQCGQSVLRRAQRPAHQHVADLSGRRRGGARPYSRAPAGRSSRRPETRSTSSRAIGRASSIRSRSTPASPSCAVRSGS